MTRKNDPEHVVKVAEMLPSTKGAQVGRPRKIVLGAMRSKLAFPSTGSTSVGTGGNFYSPELSTDFLELPQTLDEQRNYFRFFYDNDPFVSQAIDLHTELPLSKVRLGLPQAQDQALAEKSLRFFERWIRKIKLLQRLVEITFEYNLIGEAAVFCEDGSPDMPREIWEEPVRIVHDDGRLEEAWRPRPKDQAQEDATKWLKKNYRGWSAIRVLPPEQVKVESFPFTDEKLIQFVPDSKSKAIVQKANEGDVNAIRVVNSLPEDIYDSVVAGQPITLNTDPDAGSFVFFLARKKSQYEEHGKSLLQRCLRTLIFRDKVRQSLTSIASRHMTPYRLVYAEDMDDAQIEELREQVDLALQDPDYSIITNFQVNWEEMGADQRLPDWSWVFEMTDRQLYAGLGVTESLLSGESSYSGDRINLEVINTRYMLYRELIQEMVEDFFFAPMARKMGFVEEDEDGALIPVIPRLTFTRLALRDNQETFDALLNLYQKGSLDIDVILEQLNIDPVMTKKKLERDMFTINDASFNEVLRSAYSQIGTSLPETTDITEKVADNLHLTYKKPQEGGNRF